VWSNQGPDMGTCRPGRVEKCRPPLPGGGKDHERPFAIPSFHQNAAAPGHSPQLPLSGPWVQLQARGPHVARGPNF